MDKAFENTLALLRARNAAGPACYWCEATAQEYESEYAIDHNASSDFLTFADQERTACRAGLHRDEPRFVRLFTYHGRTRWPYWHRVVATNQKEQRDGAA